MWSDDPLSDFANDDLRQASWEAKRPVCDGCGEHIIEEFAYVIDGKVYCKDCIDECKVNIEED